MAKIADIKPVLSISQLLAYVKFENLLTHRVHIGPIRNSDLYRKPYTPKTVRRQH